MQFLSKTAFFRYFIKIAVYELSRLNESIYRMTSNNHIYLYYSAEIGQSNIFDFNKIDSRQRIMLVRKSVNS